MASKTNSCKLLFDVGGTFLKAILADTCGNLLTDTAYEVAIASDGTREEITCAIAEAVAQGASLARGRGLTVTGVGVDFPGPFDYAEGIPLMDHKFRAIKGMDLRDFIKSLPELDSEVEVRFMHDVNAALMGEISSGNGRGAERVALVTIGTGLGFGCSLQGKLQLSDTGAPGISIFRTPCGDGILEDYVSKRGITRLYLEAGGAEQGITVAEIAGRAFGGDANAIAAFNRAGSILGKALAPVLGELMIDTLLFGGQISKSFELFEASLREELKGVASLRSITPARHISQAPFHGLISIL